MANEEFKLDINVSKKNIETMAKQIIREKIDSQIQEAMKNINIDKIIEDKLKSIDSVIGKKVENKIKEIVENMEWKIRGEMNQEIRKVILEEIQKKPLTGNVYLKVSNIETDYDNY